MGKVQILAVLTMDGCLSSELYDKAHQDLCLDRCGLDEIRKKAFYRVTPDYSISMLHEWRKDCTNIRYLAEATPDTADYINGLLRMHAVDEIILYTVPFISGSGRHFFKSALPEQHWTLSSLKSYPNGVCRIIYILDKKARQPKCAASIHFYFQEQNKCSDYKQFKSEIICPCEKILNFIPLKSSTL